MGAHFCSNSTASFQGLPKEPWQPANTETALQKNFSTDKKISEVLGTFFPFFSFVLLCYKLPLYTEIFQTLFSINNAERVASDAAVIWAESYSPDGPAQLSISAVKNPEAKKRGKWKSCQKLPHCPFFSWLPVQCVPRHQTETPHLPVLKGAFLSCALSAAQFALIQPDDHCVAQPQSTDTMYVMLSRVWPGVFVRNFLPNSQVWPFFSGGLGTEKWQHVIYPWAQCPPQLCTCQNCLWSSHWFWRRFQFSKCLCVSGLEKDGKRVQAHHSK